MICIDNSEWMRNSDYSPSRFQAQADAVSFICGAKTQSNSKNTVGILTIVGKGVRVLATPTSELGKILSCMHGTYFFLSCLETIRTLELALKHRQSKNQQQRIIVFAGRYVILAVDLLEEIVMIVEENVRGDIDVMIL
ncbi:hypothetical protein Gotur_013474 [Gossypium turneri]